jgi:hypothetical protein
VGLLIAFVKYVPLLTGCTSFVVAVGGVTALDRLSSGLVDLFITDLAGHFLTVFTSVLM